MSRRRQRLAVSDPPGSAPPDLPASERLAALRRYERAIDAIGEHLPPDEPPFPELAQAIARHQLPLAPFRDLLSAFRQDVTTTRYADFAQLQD